MTGQLPEVATDLPRQPRLGPAPALGQPLDRGLGVDGPGELGAGPTRRGRAARGRQHLGPGSVWDPEQDAYLVHWSSTLYDNQEHEGDGRGVRAAPYRLAREGHAALMVTVRSKRYSYGR